MRHISWLVTGAVAAPAVLFLTTQVAGCGGDDAFLAPGTTGDGGVSSLDGSLPDGTVGPGQDAGDAATLPADGGDGGTTPLACDDSISPASSRTRTRLSCRSTPSPRGTRSR
jgi:hypothetical protein